MTSHHMTPCHMTPQHMTPCHMTANHMTSYHMTPHDMQQHYTMAHHTPTLFLNVLSVFYHKAHAHILVISYWDVNMNCMHSTLIWPCSTYTAFLRSIVVSLRHQAFIPWRIVLCFTRNISFHIEQKIWQFSLWWWWDLALYYSASLCGQCTWCIYHIVKLYLTKWSKYSCPDC